MQQRAPARRERGEGRGRSGRSARSDLPGARLARRRLVARAGRLAARRAASYVSHGESRSCGRRQRTKGGGDAQRASRMHAAAETTTRCPPIRSPRSRQNLTERAARGQARSAGRPRGRARPRDPHPRAAAQEQPDLRRRDRRRQDRDRRGPRAAHRRGRGARRPAAAPRSSRSISARCSPARATAATSSSASRR